MEIPRIAVDTASLSIQVSLKIAANTPNPIPIMVANNIAAKANKAVFGMVFHKISVTSFLV